MRIWFNADIIGPQPQLYSKS